MAVSLQEMRSHQLTKDTDDFKPSAEAERSLCVIHAQELKTLKIGHPVVRIDGPVLHFDALTPLFCGKRRGVFQNYLEFRMLARHLPQLVRDLPPMQLVYAPIVLQPLLLVRSESGSSDLRQYCIRHAAILRLHGMRAFTSEIHPTLAPSTMTTSL